MFPSIELDSAEVSFVGEITVGFGDNLGEEGAIGCISAEETVVAFGDRQDDRPGAPHHKAEEALLDSLGCWCIYAVLGNLSSSSLRILFGTNLVQTGDNGASRAAQLP